MKKIVSIIVIALVAMFGMNSISMAQVTAVSMSNAASDGPSVPIDIAAKGRQAVVSYLLQQVDHITIKVIGKSVMTPDGWATYFIGAKELYGLGYTDCGSFNQLSKAINGYQFSCKILPYTTDYGQQFDVRLDIGVCTADGKVAFTGTGYVPISFGKGGGVVVEKPSPGFI